MTRPPPDTSPADDPNADVRLLASRLQAIVDTAVDGIITIDDRGCIESFNPAAERLFGYSAREVIGENVRMLMPSPYHEQHDGYLDHYKATGERRILGIGREVMGQRQDGSTFPLYLAVGETWVDDRRLFAGILRDLTEEKQRERELQQTREELLMQSLFAERLSALAEMSGGIAHELNQPLSGIRVYAETAKALLDQAATESPEHLRQTLDKIIGQVDRAATVIQHMHDFAAEPEGGAEEADLVCVHYAVERLREMLGAQLASHGIRLQNDVVPELHVRFHMNRLEQVFLNLVTNARDSIVDLGERNAPHRIRIWSDSGPDGVQVRVADTGAGIPEVVRATVFHPFVTTKGPAHGTGLGLSICHGTLRSFGARIAVENTGSSGTVMLLTFPYTTGETDA